MGVNIRTNTTVGKDVILSQLLEEIDAVLITTGSKDTTNLEIPGVNLKRVLSGYQFLESVFLEGLESYQSNPITKADSDSLTIAWYNAMHCVVPVI